MTVGSRKNVAKAGAAARMAMPITDVDATVTQKIRLSSAMGLT